MNTLYYGDNLDILIKNIDSASVDLVYLDPPFQSGKNYNIIFKPVKGATSQIKTFEDTWNWGEEAEKEYTGLITGTLTKEPPTQKLIDLMKAMRSYLDTCPLMAYLCMMAPRLLELKRVLKPTGSIYLHCDPTASHYLKLLMDLVFGGGSFRNELIWCYETAGKSKKQFSKKHDVIFYYSKTAEWTFNVKDVSIPRKPNKHMRVGYDENGRQYEEKTDSKSGKVYRWYFDEGRLPPDYWVDIQFINWEESQRLGYPTQKPEALLERIIKASSNEGDVVLDPFCGCGTAVAVAEKLNRKWLGIDITYLSIDVIRKRFISNGILEGKDFKIKGVPTDVHSAGKLFEESPFQFEVWAVSQLNAMPTPKSGDKGVDGVINFLDNERKDKIGKGIISVKGGKAINPAMVRELKGTIESQSAAFGILITQAEPTPGMKTEAAQSGVYEFKYAPDCVPILIPRIQLITVENLFASPIQVKLPPNIYEPYKKPDINKSALDQREIQF